MSFRTLPTTIRETLSSLYRTLGCLGLFAGILFLPFVLLAALVSALFPRLSLERLLWAKWLSDRSLEIEGRTLVLSWLGHRDSARLALGDAVRILLVAVTELPAVGAVKSLEIRNPETGFAIDPECLEVITENFGDRLTDALLGAKLEYGALVVNEVFVLNGFDVETRNPWSGHLSIDFPEQWDSENTMRSARELGFGATLPGNQSR